MTATSTTLYYPAAGDGWERRNPAEAGFDATKLADAVAFIEAQGHDLEHEQRVALDLPDNETVGPIKPKGGVNGLVVRDGYIVAEFGETASIEMTYSVAKSYLSTVAGLAFDRGMIPDLDQPVRMTLDAPEFQGEHNGKITWRHLLQQTSEWTGTLWGMRDLADRRKGVDREIHEPGTFYEYNDVRVNLLGYALLLLWRRPLRDVLHENVMGPIGGEDDWQWHGYRTSWVDIDGHQIQSVSGGTHFGGGVWTGSRNHARLGLLFLRNGQWDGQQIISERWVREATTPSEVEPTYGYMWWVNPDGMHFPRLSPRSYSAQGAGGHVIWVSPDHDLVVVLRWVKSDSREECLVRVVDALSG
jgi:CubicO group peptidase (beta-lactamase class C family)